ncbi:hypothetical protein [Parapusillimonas granuli]|uniref:Uncharacterized protein n=1 Tax=Parapusillimonas granuli TaxID=380911 RepID=A0A853FTP3_9BURK|nr:hypothetical protein [Parapusillimonas granuli]MBB5214982.1 hypothetical protein [Parapusillimonas granuli]NYT49304.1 hypothetical protein [Parapusillimonas granuli]
MAALSRRWIRRGPFALCGLFAGLCRFRDLTPALVFGYYADLRSTSGFSSKANAA